jgi:hypothetical protein
MIRICFLLSEGTYFKDLDLDLTDPGGPNTYGFGGSGAAPNFRQFARFLPMFFTCQLVDIKC